MSAGIQNLGLTERNVRQHLPRSLATAKGHLDQTRQRTTTPPTSNPDDFEDFNPLVEPVTQFVYAAVVHTETGQIYTDLTGRFPHQSSRGNNYIFVLYDYDSNAILATAIKTRSGTSILNAYKELHGILASRGLKPKLQRLDNEASTALKQYISEQDITYQLTPAHMHRRNAAERAIRTFKNHFIAGLASTDKLFPIHLWDRLLPQAILTLNLLRTSRINPQLSAYSQLFGAFDFTKTPLAPPGTKVLAHEKPAKRQSWAPHGVDGWYIGPAMEHLLKIRLWH